MSRRRRVREDPLVARGDGADVLRVLFDDPAGGLGVAGGAGGEEPLAVAGLRLRAVPQQQLGDLGVAVPARQLIRGEALPVARTDVGAVLEQQLDNRGAAA